MSKEALAQPVQEPVESPDDWSDWKVTPPAQEFVCSTGLCHYKPAAPVQPVASLKEADVLMIAEAHNIDPRTKGLYGFYIDCISSQPAAQPTTEESSAVQQEPVQPVAWMYELIIDGEVCNVECTNVNWNPEYQPFGRAGIDFVEGGKVTKTPLYTTPPAAQPAPVTWQHIESAPKDGTRILCKNEKGLVDICEWTEDRFTSSDDRTFGGHLAYTSWTPLPHSGPTLPATQRPWVGLTDEELNA